MAEIVRQSVIAKAYNKILRALDPPPMNNKAFATEGICLHWTLARSAVNRPRRTTA